MGISNDKHKNTPRNTGVISGQIIISRSAPFRFTHREWNVVRDVTDEEAERGVM